MKESSTSTRVIRDRPGKRALTLSVLSFYKEEMTLRHLKSTLELLAPAAKVLGLDPALVLRNNAPDSDDGAFADGLRRLQQQTGIPVIYQRSSHNLGFGAGHNANFRLRPGDIFWALNNDIGFPHLHWLADVLQAFEDETVALVGCRGSPKTFQAELGAGRERAMPGAPALYADGAILFARSAAFSGGDLFDERFDFAYFEDADLSLRTIRRGHGIAYVEIPHEHFRSSSANLIPGAIKRTMIEANRAKFLARWGEALRRGGVSGSVLVDARSLGFGDVVAALRPIRRVYEAARAGGAAVDIRVQQPGLAFLFARLTPEAKVLTEETQPDRREYDSVRSFRGINFAAPFHLEDLAAAHFGVPELGAPLDLAGLLDLAPPRRRSRRRHAVVHFDYRRSAFEGRGLPYETYREAVRALLAMGIAVSVVGEAADGADFAADGLEVGDLRGKTDLQQLFATIAAADLFVGIDSGPLHIAQALGVPAFGIFGATHPLARMRPGPRNGAFMAADLPCLGCYHTVIEPSFNWCLRRDQACMTALPVPRLVEAVRRFAAGEAMDWSPFVRSFDAVRAKWLAMQTCNPLYRNRLLRAGEGEAGTIADLLLRVLDVYEDRTREAVASAVSDELATLKRAHEERQQQFEAYRAAKENEIAELRKAVAELRRLGRPGASPAPGNGAHTATEIVEFLAAEIRLDEKSAFALGCELSLGRDGCLVRCRNDDPQIYLRQPVTAGPRGLKATFNVDAESGGEFQVYYKPVDRAEFNEAMSAKTGLSQGANLIHLRIPPVGPKLHLRIDPLNRTGDLVIRKFLLDTP